MIITRLSISAFGAVALATLVACSGISAQQQDAFAGMTRSLAGSQQAIVVTGCVIRDEIGEDYIVREPSEEAATSAANASLAYLRGRGMTIIKVANPLICGLLDSDKAEIKTIAEMKRQARSQFNGPIPVSAEQQIQPPLVAAYAELFRQVRISSVSLSDRMEGKPLLGTPEPIRLSPAHRQVLQSALGTNVVWIIGQGSLNVSAGKTIGMILLTALVTGAATGGSVISYSAPITGFGSNVALVRLDSSTLLWTNALGPGSVPPSNDSDEVIDWAKLVFAPMFDPESAPQRVQLIAALEDEQLKPFSGGERVRSHAVVAPAVTGVAESGFAAVGAPGTAPQLVTAPTQVAAGPQGAPWSKGSVVTISKPVALHFRPTSYSEIDAPHQAGTQFKVSNTIGAGATAW